jgi:hypothetical protein
VALEQLQMELPAQDLLRHLVRSLLTAAMVELVQLARVDYLFLDQAQVVQAALTPPRPVVMEEQDY